MATVSLTFPIIGLTHDETHPPGVVWQSNIPVLLLDDAVPEPVYASFRLPDNYVGEPTLRVQFSALSAISGNMGIDCAVMAVSQGEAAMNLSYDISNISAPVSVPGTVGWLSESVVPLTNDDGLAAGDLVHLKSTDMLPWPITPPAIWRFAR